jgi:hypothetical protein
MGLHILEAAQHPVEGLANFVGGGVPRRLLRLTMLCEHLPQERRRFRPFTLDPFGFGLAFLRRCSVREPSRRIWTI